MCELKSFQSVLEICFLYFLPILRVGSFEGSTWHSKCTFSPSMHCTLLRCEMKTGSSYTVSDVSLWLSLGASSASINGNASGRSAFASNQWRSIEI